MLMKISKFNLSYLTKSCRHALSPNEKILRHIYFFVAFCDNGDRQREPCLCICSCNDMLTNLIKRWFVKFKNFLACRK